MSFTISEAFDLVFGSEGSDIAKAYECRRWFRVSPPLEEKDPGPSEQAAERARKVHADITNAEDVLKATVLSDAADWPDCLSGSEEEFDARRHLPPRTPYDVFAISAFIIEHAGIYHHLQPAKKPFANEGPAPNPAARNIGIDENDRALVSEAAKAWRRLSNSPGRMRDLARGMTDPSIWAKLFPLFESWWVVFGCHGSHEVQERPMSKGEALVPRWWKHAWRLLAIADEAASGTGFNFEIEAFNALMDGDDTDLVWFEGEVMMELIGKALSDHETSGEAVGRAFSEIGSLSVARPSLLNVLPKVRTPSVGCTLRSLSHHLALLPPVGVVRGRWTPNYTHRPASTGQMPRNSMNLLLIPMPYSLDASSFVPTHFEDLTNAAAGAEPKIGYFEVDQSWLAQKEELLNFVKALIKQGKARAAEIHGLVFPELALTHAIFEEIRDLVRGELPDAEILISGTSTDSSGNAGNFVAASTFKDRGDGHSVRETVREKHHRWKLDASQLRDYGLLGALSPELQWWEDINLSSRQVDFTVMRRDSVFAAMICEDLARVDPCQQMIRAIGPNLVVALLMDAPQVEARWPARYATVLAEDPGCAVLTLTSRGLMTLQHRTGTYRSSGNDRIIALWRDDGAARPVTINCPYDAQAVILTITAGKSRDVSLDGRVDKHAKAWRFAGQMPVRIPDAKDQFKAVLGSEDIACW